MKILRNLFLSVKVTTKGEKFSFLGIPVYKRKYFEGKIRRFVFGLPAGTTEKSQKVSVRLSDSAFVPFALNDETLLKELRSLGSFMYIPNPGNLGDMLIAAATLQFFERNNLPYTLYSEADDKSCDGPVVFGGGGSWIENYEKGYVRFLRYFKNAEKIVILPSSFRGCERLLDVVDERFTLFCREEASFAYLCGKCLRAKVILDHDMAFRLGSGILSQHEVTVTEADRRALDAFRKVYPQGRDVGYFLRCDGESVNDYETDVDVSSYFRGSENAKRSFINFCAIAMLSAVEGVSAVVTDRLHVSIAAALMGREVYMLDNSYKKLSGIYERTMKNRNGVHLTDSLPLKFHDEKKSNPGDNLQRLLNATNTSSLTC